jgi:hypothetical protein
VIAKLVAGSMVADLVDGRVSADLVDGRVSANLVDGRVIVVAGPAGQVVVGVAVVAS